MRTIEAVIFDLDGLMIDSEPMAYEAWSRVLEDYDQQLDSETFAQMIGLRLEESSKLVKEHFQLDTSPENLAALEQRYMTQIMAEGIPTLPGLADLLREIRRRMLPWAVATSSRREYAVQVLKQLHLFERCQAIASGDEVKNGKPEPDVYLLAAQRLEVDPRLCMALEDSVPGVISSKMAGMLAVAVPNGETSTMVFDDADFIFQTLGEVAENLDQLIGWKGAI